jgi:DNA damage-inducible protein 1
MTVDTLRSSIQAEARIEPSSQHLYHNGQLISDYSMTMSDLGITDGDMLALHVRDMRGNTGVPAPAGAGGRPQQQPPSAPRGGARPPQQDPELIRLQVLGNAHLRAELANSQPEMAAALDDPRRFAQLFNATVDRDARERTERQQMIQRLNDDPFDVEAQARIEEMIRQERVMENLQNAMEHNPEGKQAL